MSLRTWSLVAFALVSTPAVAGNNMFGGQIVEQSLAYAAAGYPGVELGIRFPTSTKLEITPTLRFSYIDWWGLEGGGTLSPGVDARLMVVDAGNFHGSVSASVPIHLHFNNGTNVGPVGIGLLHPGFIMDYQVGDRVALDFGVRFEADAFMELLGPQYPLYIQVPATLGVDVAAAETLQVAVKVEAGPTYATTAGALLRASLGVGLAL